MARFLKNRIQSKGKSPGTLTFIGKQKASQHHIHLIKYNSEKIIQKEYVLMEEAIKQIEDGFVTWINIDGLHNTELLATIENLLHISPLVLEDILNTDHRPNIWINGDSISTILKTITFIKDENRIQEEQVSFIVGKNYLITLQEQSGSLFEPVKERLKQFLGRARFAGPDYLYYTLFDSLVDNYILSIEALGSAIEVLDSKLSNPGKQTLDDIYKFKTEISYTRKLIRPVKEITIRLQKMDSDLLAENTRSYINDLDQLTTQAVESVEFYHTMITDQLNIYQTNISQRQNEIMKILTIFSSIFIPLTFITGIYGTNFDHLPELHFKYSYFFMWGAFFTIAGTMLFLYKKHKWF